MADVAVALIVICCLVLDFLAVQLGQAPAQVHGWDVTTGLALVAATCWFVSRRDRAR